MSSRLRAALQQDVHSLTVRRSFVVRMCSADGHQNHYLGPVNYLYSHLLSILDRLTFLFGNIAMKMKHLPACFHRCMFILFRLLQHAALTFWIGMCGVGFIYLFCFGSVFKLKLWFGLEWLLFSSVRQNAVSLDISVTYYLCITSVVNLRL